MNGSVTNYAGLWSVKHMYRVGHDGRLVENLNQMQLERSRLLVEGDFLFCSDKHDESRYKRIQGRCAGIGNDS